MHLYCVLKIYRWWQRGLLSEVFRKFIIHHNKKTVPTEFIMSGYFKKETSSTRLMSMTFIRLISFICMTYILILP